MSTSMHRNRAVSLDWFDTGGGPYVVVPTAQASLWRGIRNDDHESDFDLACDVSDYLDLVPYPGGDALVLADAPFPTAVVSAPLFGGVYLIRLLWGDVDDEAVLRAIHDVALDGWSNEGFVFDAGSGRCVLFDAINPGDNALESVSFDVAPGRHAIETADVEPNDSLCLLVHRLVPLS